MSAAAHFLRAKGDKIPVFIAALDSGGSSMTLPAHQIGQLLFLAVSRHADGVIPSLPDASWTSTAADAAVLAFGGTSISIRLGWKIAASAAEPSGIWTNGQQLLAAVYGDVDQTNPVSTGAFVNDPTVAGTFPGLTLPAKRLIVGGSKLDGGGTVPLRSEFTLRAARQSEDVNLNPVVRSEIGDSAPAVFDAWAAQGVTKANAQEAIFWSAAIKGAAA